MNILVGVIVGYSFFWLGSMYFILRRLHTIRKRTEKRLLDFNSEYLFPSYNHPWIFSVVFGLLSYLASVIVIITFLK